MTGLLLETLPQIVVGRMLNGAVEGLVLAALAWILLQVVGRRSSSTRFAVWFVALLAVGFLPWVDSFHWGPTAASTESSGAAILIPSSWALGLFYLWAVISFALLTRVGLGMWQIRRLRLDSRAMDSASLNPVLRSALQCGCTRPVALYISQSVGVPLATGFMRPMIVLPEWAVKELSVEELNVVLLHEVAHLRRWDDWTNLAQKVVRAVLFFHPVVWWLESHLALEREIACDDLVVAATSSPRAYAQCLVALAEKSLGRRNFALAQAAVNRVRHTSLRIRQILDGNRSGPAGVWKPAVGFAATAAIACLFFVNQTPKLVGFAPPVVGNRETPVVATTFPSSRGSAIPLAAIDRSTIQRKAVSHPGVRSAYSTTPVRARVSRPVSAPPLPQLTARDGSLAVGSPERFVQAATLFSSATPDADSAVYRGVAFTAEATVFVVMQDQHFTASGDKVVRFNVYRLTVFYPEFYPSNSQKTLSKSI